MGIKNNVIMFIFGIMLIGNVMAISGVSPGSYEIDFKPDLEKEFVFDFVIDNGKVDVFVEGELKDLVELNKKEIWGRQNVVAKLILPSKIETPGINQIFINAGDVTGILKINVPYPNEFVELILKAPDINIGEVVKLNLDIINKGEVVNVISTIEVYKLIDGIGKLVEIIDLENTTINNSKNYYLELNSTNYSAGEYMIVAIVKFGKEQSSVENSFRIGEKKINIIGIAREFKENKVSKFNIDVKSLWNSDIRELYAEIKIKDSEYSFVTTAISLKAFEEKRLSGFFDTSKISGYEKDLEIILHYDGEEVVDEFSIEIIKGFDYILSIVVVLSLIIIGVLYVRGKVLFNNIAKTKKDKKDEK